MANHNSWKFRNFRCRLIGPRSPIFGSERDKDILIRFLNDLLGFTDASVFDFFIQLYCFYFFTILFILTLAFRDGRKKDSEVSSVSSESRLNTMEQKKFISKVIFKILIMKMDGKVLLTYCVEFKMKYKQ